MSEDDYVKRYKAMLGDKEAVGSSSRHTGDFEPLDFGQVSYTYTCINMHVR